MKRQIRCGVYETNSSSTHSLTMMMKDDYDKWEKEELYLSEEGNKKLYTKEEVIEFLKEQDKEYGRSYCDYSDDDEFDDARRENDFKLSGEYDEYLEDFYEEFTTPNGETVVAFGEYGYGC